MRILIATQNPGKIREFRQMLDSVTAEWDDLSAHCELPAVAETGRTFLANACLKAAGYAERLATWALADDSGLEVDALDGAPGVHSARWAKMHDAGEGDADNNRLLLEQMRDVPEQRRTARFVCLLALANERGRIVLTARDSIEGRLLHAPRGSHGFGYDPLFFVPQLGRTTAELDPAEKHRISHRGKALSRLRELMARTVFAKAESQIRSEI